MRFFFLIRFSAVALLVIMLVVGGLLPSHADNRVERGAIDAQSTSEATPAAQDCPQFPPGIEATPGVTVEATSAATTEPTPAVPGYLGISATDSFDGCGALVDAVDPQGPAQQGGLQVDDLIWGIDRTLVRDRETLRTAIVRLPPGTAITLWVKRGEETFRLPITLGTRPATVEPTAAPPQDATAEATPAQ
jgi:S1-C subfamily serine protease